MERCKRISSWINEIGLEKRKYEKNIFLKIYFTQVKWYFLTEQYNESKQNTLLACFLYSSILQSQSKYQNFKQ